jgi:hypothetical protein
LASYRGRKFVVRKSTKNYSYLTATNILVTETVVPHIITNWLQATKLPWRVNTENTIISGSTKVGLEGLH